MNRKIAMMTVAAVGTGMLAFAADAENSGKLVAAPVEGRGSYRVEHLGKSIDQMIYEFMESENIPGMTLAIVQAPYIPRVVGYGVATRKVRDILEKTCGLEVTAMQVSRAAQMLDCEFEKWRKRHS